MRAKLLYAKKCRIPKRGGNKFRQPQLQRYIYVLKRDKVGRGSSEMVGKGRILYIVGLWHGYSTMRRRMRDSLITDRIFLIFSMCYFFLDYYFRNTL